MLAKLENAHSLLIDKVIALLETDQVNGLPNETVNIRLKTFGKNILVLHQQKSWWRTLINQFESPLVWVLAFAAILAFLFDEWLEGVAIVIVMVINALIGFFMEWQANRSMEALRNLSEVNAIVIRDGKKQNIKASDLTLGDLLLLESGDVVTADCRLVEQNNLGVKESALTGESMPVSKQLEPVEITTPLAERSNLLYKGTIINRGNARAVVTAIGANTELGHIAKLTQNALEEITPLEKKLAKLSRKLIGLTLVLASIIFVAGILHGRSVLMMIETAIALAIAAIPEGLPIVATIALAKGMVRLAHKKVIVKKLSAVETLGETQVIFTDKTGTLTENKMKVETFVFDNEHINISSAKAPSQNLCFDRLMKVAILLFQCIN